MIAAEASVPEALREPGHGPVVVLGGPGTGKTTLARTLVTRRLRCGVPSDSVLLMAASRTQADRLRDEVAALADVTLSTPIVRTWSAYAFDLIVRAREAGLLPLAVRPPRLLSGPEQDAAIAALLAGHREGLGGPAWPESLGEAVSTRGFRREIREFLDRCAEAGLTAAEVREWGSRLGVQAWEAAADFMSEYTDVADLAHPEAYAPSELIDRALRLLEAHPALLHAERERLGLIVADDLQDATASQQRLIGLLANGKDAVLFASPDTAVQGFRGARVDLLRSLPSRLGSGGEEAPVLRLDVQHRLPAPIADVVRRVSGRLPAPLGRPRAHGPVEPDKHPNGASGPERERPADASGAAKAPEAPPSLGSHLLESPAHRDRFVSAAILDAHLHRGVPYEHIAVIVRNGAQVQQTSRALGLDGISTQVPPAELPLREEAAVRPLLSLLELVLEGGGKAAEGGKHEAAARVEALLTGSYGRATSLDVRALRQELLARERARKGSRSSTELLAGLLEGDVSAEQLRELGPAALAAVRILSMVEAAREHLRGEASPATALWALWDAASVAGAWRKQALEERGLRSDRAHRDLDAVMALFQAAERFGDQFPGAGVAAFVEHVRSQDLPMDSLAGKGSAVGRVHVLTPAAAAGGQWDTVIVSGLQEGAWPSTGLRGELLRSEDLVAVAEHGEQVLRGVRVSDKLRRVREDELRQFVCALSRATHTVELVAVADAESMPSSFLDLTRVPTAEPLAVQAVPRASTLPSLTALLRRTLEEAHDPAEANDAAATLARMAAAQPAVAGVHPSQWWGLAPLSSTDPVVAQGAPVRVSPSKVQTVMDNALDWFVGAAGGLATADLARSLGTLVHSIAETHPDAGEEELLAALALRWRELDLPENWEGASERERAQRMMARLAAYYVSAKEAGRTALALEAPFRVDLPARSDGEHPLQLTGSIDRLEADAEGLPYVVDLKTGKVLPTKAEAEQHAQLGTYQAAIRAGALDGVEGLRHPRSPAGAALVGIGKETVKPSLIVQGPVQDGDDWATELVADAAQRMAAASFLAEHEQGAATRCAHPGVCPLCSQGRSVTEP